MSSLYSPIFRLALALLVLSGSVNFSGPRSIMQCRLGLWIDQFLLANFAKAGFDFDLDSIHRLTTFGLFLAIICGLIISPLLAIVFPILAFSVFVIFLNQRTKKSAQLNERVNDEVCYFLARSLRSGRPLDFGIIEASKEYPGSRLVTHIARHIGRGETLASSIQRLGTSKQPVLNMGEKILCATISLAQEMGGNSARVFERIGDNFHQSYELNEETNAALTQVRMSVYVISLLPIVMLLFSFLLGSDSAIFLFTQPIGWICLIVGIALESSGIIWMKKMVDSGVKVWNF